MNLKKWIALFLIVCLIATLSCGCLDMSSRLKGISSYRNCNIVTTTDSCVSFNPKCPNCGHLSLCSTVLISKGEHYNAYAACESCGEVYEVYVSR